MSERINIKTSTDNDLIKKLNIIHNRLHNYHIYFNFNAIIVDKKYYISKVKSKESFLDSHYIISSIMTRLESILKYYFLLYKDNSMYYQLAKKDYINNVFNDYNNINSNWYKDLQFNSEVILQHLISLFDYLANLFLLTFVGRHKQKGKWKSRHELNKPKSLKLYEKCENIQTNYLNRLAELRSQVFHEGLMRLQVDSSHSLTKIRISKNLFVGDKFKKLLYRSEFIEYDEKVSIFNGFNLLITRVLNDTMELLKEMKTDFQNDLKYRLRNQKEKKPVLNPFGDEFKSVLELLDHLWHYDAYFWNYREKFKALDYSNRKFNENMFPMMILPEEL